MLLSFREGVSQTYFARGVLAEQFVGRGAADLDEARPQGENLVRGQHELSFSGPSQAVRSENVASAGHTA